MNFPFDETPEETVEAKTPEATEAEKTPVEDTGAKSTTTVETTGEVKKEEETEKPAENEITEKTKDETTTPAEDKKPTVKDEKQEAKPWSLFPEEEKKAQEQAKKEEEAKKKLSKIQLPPDGIRKVDIYGNMITIDDTTLNLEDIRKEIAKTYPEFADPSVQMDYDNKTGVIKPKRAAGKKGAALPGMVGHFDSFDDMFKNPMAINIVEDEDGKFEVRKTEFGFLSVPIEGAAVAGKVGVIPALPKIPMKLFFDTAETCFNHCPDERLVQIYWDKNKEEYFLFEPPQVSTPYEIKNERPPEMQGGDKILVVEIHSHPESSKAKFSKTDDEDEVATGIYGVIAILNTRKPIIAMRISCGGKFFPISVTEIFDFPEHQSLNQKEENQV